MILFLGLAMTLLPTKPIGLKSVLLVPFLSPLQPVVTSVRGIFLKINQTVSLLCLPPPRGSHLPQGKILVLHSDQQVPPPTLLSSSSSSTPATLPPNTSSTCQPQGLCTCFPWSIRFSFFFPTRSLYDFRHHFSKTSQVSHHQWCHPLPKE